MEELIKERCICCSTWRLLEKLFDMCYIVFLEILEQLTYENLYLLWSFLYGEQHCMLVSNTNMFFDFVGDVRWLILRVLLGLEVLHFCNYVFIVVHLEHIANWSVMFWLSEVQTTKETKFSKQFVFLFFLVVASLCDVLGFYLGFLFKSLHSKTA